MQRRTLITKGPHSITIRDAPALAEQSCSCVDLAKEATDGYVEGLTRLSGAYAQ